MTLDRFLAGSALKLLKVGLLTTSNNAALPRLRLCHGMS
jgi:hypothetical protein